MTSHQKRPSDPPDELCIACSAWRSWQAWRRWIAILVPIMIGLTTTFGVSAVTACNRAAVMQQTVETLSAAQVAALVDRRELRKSQHELQRAQADAALAASEKWGRVEAALVRLDERLNRVLEGGGSRR